jgi:hypothetical protein
MHHTGSSLLQQAVRLHVVVLASLSTARTLRRRGTPLVEALYHKPEGRGFDSRWGHWIFFFNLPNTSNRKGP